MDELGLGLADLMLLTFLVGMAQGLAGVILEAYRGNQDHPLDELLRALVLIHQEEIPKLREAIEELIEKRGGRR